MTTNPANPVVLALLAACWLAPHAAAQVERISIADDEAQANADSYEAAISDDGSVVAFRSNADNLVSGDTNEFPDIFVRDLDAATTESASVRPDGQPQTDFSKRPSISGDGRFVTFEAKHPDRGILVTALRDRQSGTTEYLVPGTSSSGPSAPPIARLQAAMSGDGRFVAFVTRDSLQGAWPTTIRPPNDDSNTTFDVFVYDRDTQPTPPIERVSRLSDGTGLDVDSRAPSLSDDGNRIAFETYSELILDDGNNAPGIVVRNRQTDSLDVVSQALDSSSGDGPSFDPAVAGNGSIVAFRSAATNLVAGDTNARHDILVRDLAGSTTTRVSVATGGGQANGHSADPSVSDDGRFVAFRSDASNLVPADTNGRADIFVHDRTTGTTVRVGQPSGGESNGSSAAPAISGDGAWIVFESDATNLVPGDDNAARDLFRVPNPLATP